MDHEIETIEELLEIARTDRQRPVLVRFTCCRFSTTVRINTTAHDAKRIIDALTQAGDSLKDMFCQTPSVIFMEGIR